jgi:endo-1,4-beta-xylanase
MSITLIAIPALILSILVASLQGKEINPPTLKDLFKGSFLIGAAINKQQFEDEGKPTLSLVAHQFNSISSENLLKWGPFNPTPGIYKHETADAYVEFGNKNSMYVVGHVLFWHNQTPEWVFQDKSGRPLERKELLKRMRERVRHVAKRYGSRIDAWDVVNESYMGDGSLRGSKWTKSVGSDFVEQAFRIASEELPSEVELLYNDYGMTAKGKRDAVVKMIGDLNEKQVRIDGVGIQGHWSLNGPSIAEIEASIIAFSDAGVDVHITELDIDVLPREKGMFEANIDKRLEESEMMNPYRDGLPEDMQQKLAKRYSDIFRLFLKHQDKIRKVTFWGATDKYSWLNNWPIKGRTSYPLLFDRVGKPKAAFYSVVGLKGIEANNRLKATQ